MQVKKEQLELDMEQQTGSKSEKNYVKDVYCHPDYLSYMQTFAAATKLLQSCPTLCDPIDSTGLPYPWDSPGKNTGVGCHFLLQEIFPNQGSSPGLPHCGQMLYHLSHQGRLKLGKDYIKALYSHLVYLTYIQSASCEMLGWIKQKLESRLLGEMSTISYRQITTPFWQKVKRN